MPKICEGAEPKKKINISIDAWLWEEASKTFPNMSFSGLIDTLLLDAILAKKRQLRVKCNCDYSKIKSRMWHTPGCPALENKVEKEKARARISSDPAQTKIEEESTPEPPKEGE